MFIAIRHATEITDCTNTQTGNSMWHMYILCYHLSAIVILLQNGLTVTSKSSVGENVNYTTYTIPLALQNSAMINFTNLVKLVTRKLG